MWGLSYRLPQSAENRQRRYGSRERQDPPRARRRAQRIWSISTPELSLVYDPLDLSSAWTVPACRGKWDTADDELTDDHAAAGRAEVWMRGSGLGEE